MQSKQTQLKLRKIAEKQHISMFLLDHITDDADGELLPTHIVFDSYRKWRSENDFPHTAYTLDGFGKMLPFKRIATFSKAAGYHKSIVGKKLR